MQFETKVIIKEKRVTYGDFIEKDSGFSNATELKGFLLNSIRERVKKDFPGF